MFPRTVLLFLLSAIVLSASLQSQEDINFSQPIKQAPPKQSFFANLITKVLMYIGLKPGITPNVLDLMFTATDLYQHNISGILSKCYVQHGCCYADLAGKLMGHMNTCAIDPAFKILESLNGSYIDVMKSYEVLSKVWKNFHKQSTVSLLLDLTAQEQAYFFDIVLRFNNSFGSIRTLIDLPTCLKTHLKQWYADVREEMGISIGCVLAELTKLESQSIGSLNASFFGHPEATTQNVESSKVTVTKVTTTTKKTTTTTKKNGMGKEITTKKNVVENIKKTTEKNINNNKNTDYNENTNINSVQDSVMIPDEDWSQGEWYPVNRIHLK